MWHVGWRLYFYLLILLFDGLARRGVFASITMGFHRRILLTFVVVNLDIKLLFWVSTYVAIAVIFSSVLFPNCVGLKRQKNFGRCERHKSPLTGFNI